VGKVATYLTKQKPKQLLVEECRQQVKLVSIPGKFRLTAELILKDGTRRIYRAKSIDKDAAVTEVLTFVQAIEHTTGELVVWKFRGDSTYHMSTNYHPKPSFFKRLANYFFDLDD